jgi:ABC-type branched-subunit amino acid transport system ATPase component
MPTSSAERDRPRPHLELADVSAGYGGAPVIADVSLTVGPAEIVAVVGPNGAGKSTLLKTVLGFLRPSQGSISLAGQRIDRLPTSQVARRGVGYVPQVRDVFEPLTVRENLEMGGYLLPRNEVAAAVERVLAVFPRLGTMLGRAAGKISGGERKMLAMGRVLMINPGVFLLDEPTANLAPKVAAELLEEHVRRLAAGGASVLIVEQRARAALAISDLTYVLGGGEVRMQGLPAELSANPDFIESFLGGARALPSSDC